MNKLLNPSLEFDIPLGRQFKAVRLYRGYTLKQLGKLVGASESYLSHFEIGIRRVPSDLMVKLCIALDCPLWLLVFFVFPQTMTSILWVGDDIVNDLENSSKLIRGE